MNAKIEWDETAAESESASVGTKLLNTLVPTYNKMVDLVNRYKAATDIDEAVANAAANSDNEEVVTLRKQVEQAKRLIEHNEAAIQELVREEVLSNIDPDFDEVKYKAEYADFRATVKTDSQPIRDTFKILGYVSAEASPAGRLSNWKAETAEGEVLLKVLDFPKLEGATSTNTGGASDAVKAFNKDAKEWGRKNGFKVADKGALSTEVKEAYTKATGVSQPE